ncbi:MAG: hypothetical protein D6737_00550 [Chloroflexi bacterium]|nr:MAG: hypothetical protein CUN54_01875 [Phototrophicales bacterium]RMF82856.1 MAG: hypothetical protein D6737_00550 [Chloroflexota bacterium]
MVALNTTQANWLYDDLNPETNNDKPVYAIQDDPHNPTIMLTIYRAPGNPTQSCGYVWIRSGQGWIPSSMGEVIIDREPRPSMLFGLVTRFQKHIQETRPHAIEHEDFWKAIARLQDEALKLNF